MDGKRFKLLKKLKHKNINIVLFGHGYLDCLFLFHLLGILVYASQMEFPMIF